MIISGRYLWLLDKLTGDRVRKWFSHMHMVSIPHILPVITHVILVARQRDKVTLDLDLTSFTVSGSDAFMQICWTNLYSYTGYSWYSKASCSIIFWSMQCSSDRKAELELRG